MGGQITVLVVDEDEDVLELTETFLEREGDRLDVEAERSAKTAVDRVESEAIDCVVSDFRMPEMDGLELLEEVRDIDPEMPFFLLTASAGTETADEAEQAGVSGFVQKGAGTDHYTELAEMITAAAEN
jgi:DNA-binding NtrC family response regulator